MPRKYVGYLTSLAKVLFEKFIQSVVWILNNFCTLLIFVHSKAGISEMFEGHQGPVTSIDCHKVPGQIDFSPYFVTSSFDWTIKLWSIKVKLFVTCSMSHIQSALVISTSIISNNCFFRSENLVPVLTWKSNNRFNILWKREEIAPKEQFLLFSTIILIYI